VAIIRNMDINELTYQIRGAVFEVNRVLGARLGRRRLTQIVKGGKDHISTDYAERMRKCLLNNGYNVYGGMRNCGEFFRYCFNLRKSV
jgi:hypothetical protein